MLVYNKTQADIGNAIAEALTRFPSLTPIGNIADTMKKARNLADKAWQMAYFDGAHTIHLIIKDGAVEVIDGDDPVPTGCTIVL